MSILPPSRSPASFLVFVTNLLSAHFQNIFIIFGKNLCVYLVIVGIRCTFAPAFGKGASLFERSVSVFRFPRLFFLKKTSGKIWKICEKVLNFAEKRDPWKVYINRTSSTRAEPLLEGSGYTNRHFYYREWIRHILTESVNGPPFPFCGFGVLNNILTMKSLILAQDER